MNMVNISEFRDYIKQKNPTEIIYNDENNVDYIKGAKRRYNDISEPLRLSLSFSKILAVFNPNTIYLKGNSGTMRFNSIQKISLDFDSCLLGDIVTLFCKAEENIIAYTLIVR